MATAYRDEEEAGIDLVELWRLLFSYRWLLIACGALGVGIALVLALTADQIYRGETTVAEVRDDGMSAVGGLASQFGGLASLAGVNLFSGGKGDRNALATLKSRYLAEQFIARYKLMPVLNKGSTKPQSMWRTVGDFRANVLQVREDKRTGLAIVAVDWTDPELAARWANDYVALANEIIRGRELTESSRNVAYLNEQIAKTNVVELQRVMYSLIETETKNLMLANARSEFAFRVIDPAVKPLDRVSPKRTLMVLMGAVLGGVLGLMAMFAHRFSRRLRTESQEI